MADVLSKTQRSFNMSQIKATGTKPEEIVRKFLFSQGLRYRKNDSRLICKPDIVLTKYRTVIFVNGCFWHRHDGCKYFVWPKSNVEFWRNKIERNALRDQQVYETLQKDGWKVITVWECELKPVFREKTLQHLVEIITGKTN